MALDHEIHCQIGQTLYSAMPLCDDSLPVVLDIAVGTGLDGNELDIPLAVLYSFRY